jgi:hypothetical protein
MKKKRFTLVEMILLLASFILFSLLFHYWDVVKDWIF